MCMKQFVLFRIYIGSINFQLNEDSVRASFIPFGPIKMIDLSWDAATQKHKVRLITGFEQNMFHVNNKDIISIDGIFKVDIRGNQSDVLEFLLVEIIGLGQSGKSLKCRAWLC